MWLFFALLVLAGCGREQRFVGADGGVVHVALTPDTPPIYEDEETAVFLVETRVELDVRTPTAEEQAALARLPEGEMLPFPRLPWVDRRDFEIEIDWSLRNLGDAPVFTTFTVNGVSEFHEYVPLFNVIDDEVVPDYAQYERTIELSALETVTGTIREEEMDEIAVDLATVVNGAPSSNRIVYFENQSALDAESKQYIPSVVPGLVGMRLGLRATVATGLVLEATIRVQDVNDKLPDDVADRWMLPTPTPFMPVVPMEDEE